MFFMSKEFELGELDLDKIEQEGLNKQLVHPDNQLKIFKIEKTDTGKVKEMILGSNEILIYISEKLFITFEAISDSNKITNTEGWIDDIHFSIKDINELTFITKYIREDESLFSVADISDMPFSSIPSLIYMFKSQCSEYIIENNTRIYNGYNSAVFIDTNTHIGLVITPTHMYSIFPKKDKHKLLHLIDKINLSQGLNIEPKWEDI